MKLMKRLLLKKQSELPLKDAKRIGWARMCPPVQRALNEAHSKHRKNTPHRLVFAREPPSSLRLRLEQASIDMDDINEEPEDERLLALRKV